MTNLKSESTHEQLYEKNSARNAKDTISELVIMARIVLTYKLLQLEDVNPAVTLSFLASRDSLRPEQLFQ